MNNPVTAQSLKIKLYLDGADKAAMIENVKNPLIAGFTTNPSLMRKSGVTEYEKFCREILTIIPHKPISFEVFADDLAGMKAQANVIKTWGSNVYVKIPVINTKGQSTAPLIRDLSNSGVKLNVTAIFTLKQTLEVCEALKGGAPSVVSVFAGRIADSGRDPMPLMAACSELCQAAGPAVELLWASTREVYNIIQAEQTGCKIITAPADILKKLSGLGRDPFDLSLDTVQTFKKDSDSAGFTLEIP